MRLPAALIIALLSVASSPASAKARGTPSFDCSKAKLADEKLICDDESVAALDRKVDEVYAVSGSVHPERGAELQEQQRAWLKRRRECRDAKCIGLRYRERLTELYRLDFESLMPQLRAMTYVASSDDLKGLPSWVTGGTVLTLTFEGARKYAHSAKGDSWLNATN